MHKPSINRLGFGLLLVISLPFNSATAGVYRCKDASGATTYSQTPCKVGEKSQSMNHVQRTSDPAMAQACDAARRFSAIVFDKMQTGALPESVIDEYGGVNYINAATLNIINFVGTFRLQTETPAYQVSKLTVSKCRNGGFGQFAAGDLPLADDGLPPTMMAPPQPRTLPQQSAETPATPPNAPATPPNAPAAAPDAETIKQLEQYLEQLKAQQRP